MSDEITKKNDLAKTEIEVGEVVKDPYLNPHIVPSGIFPFGMTSPFASGNSTGIYKLDPDQITRLYGAVAGHGPFDQIYEDDE